MYTLTIKKSLDFPKIDVNSFSLKYLKRIYIYITMKMNKKPVPIRA